MSLVTLADAKAQLNITSSTQDAELQGYVDATATVAEDIAGVILPRTIVGEVHDGGSVRIALRHSPVISVESLTEYIGTTGYVLTSQPQGSTTSNYGYELVDTNGGIIVRRGSTGNLQPFFGGAGGVVCSYTAGYSTVPQAARLGALVCIQHWWETQRGPKALPLQGGVGSDGTSMIAGYAVPNYAVQLFASLSSSVKNLPGIA